MDVFTVVNMISNKFEEVPNDPAWQVIARIVQEVGAVDRRHMIEAFEEIPLSVDPYQALAINLIALQASAVLLDWSKTEKYDERIRTSPFADDPIVTAIRGLSMGSYHRNNGHFDVALQQLIRSKSVFQALSWDQYVGACSAEIGSVLLLQDDLKGAMEHYLSAVDVFRRLGAKKQQRQLLFNLGHVQHRAGLHHEALQSLLQSHEIESANQTSANKAQTMAQIAAQYKLLGNYEEADRYYVEAIAEVSRESDTNLNLSTLVGRADLAIRMGDIEKARSIISCVTDNDEYVRSPNLHIEVLSVQASLLQADGDISAALGRIRSALVLAKEYNNPYYSEELLNEVIRWPLSPAVRAEMLEQLLEIQKDKHQRLVDGYGYITDIRTRYAQEELRLEQERQREYSRIVAQTQDNTMYELGRDLHDSLGQDLTVMRLLSDRLTSRSSLSEDDYQSVVTTLQTVTQRLGDDARRIAHRLSGSAMSGAGLERALIQLKDETRLALPTLDLEIIVTGPVHDMPSLTARTMYRIVQTAIQNVIKHAQATSCSVNLISRQDEYHLAIEDNGVGFAVGAPYPGMGMREIHARAEMLAGRVRIESAPNTGTYVEVTLSRTTT